MNKKHKKANHNDKVIFVIMVLFMKKVFLLIVVSLLLTGESVIMTFPLQALFFVLAIRYCEICTTAEACKSSKKINFGRLTRGMLIILSGLLCAMLLPSFFRSLTVPFSAFAYLCVGINIFYLCSFYMLAFMKEKRIENNVLRFITTFCVVFVSVCGLSLL